MLTSARRSGGLATTSVADATPSRSPGVSSTAFRAQPPNLRFAPFMDMDFAISCPLVRRWRLISGFCPSTRTFDPCFFQTPPRGGSPCIITRPSPPSGWPEDFHLQTAEHAQHTTKPLARRTLPRWLNPVIRGTPRGVAIKVVNDITWVIEKGGLYDPFTQDDAGGTPASQLRPIHHPVLPAGRRRLRGLFSQPPDQ